MCGAGVAFEAPRPRRAGCSPTPMKLIGKEQIMKRITRWSALASVLIATLFLAPTSNAQPYGYYYGGAYGPRNEGYSVYGQGPYVYGSPTGYSYPTYGGNGYLGYGAGPYGYGSPRVYARNYSLPAYPQYRAYTPYGAYSRYGPDNPFRAIARFRQRALHPFRTSMKKMPIKAPLVVFSGALGLVP